MENFVYYNPTKLSLEKDKREKLEKFIKDAGFKKVLLVYGRKE